MRRVLFLFFLVQLSFSIFGQENYSFISNRSIYKTIMNRSLYILLILICCFITLGSYSQKVKVQDTLNFTDQNCPIIKSGYIENEKKTGEWKTYVACQNKPDSIVSIENWRNGRLKSRLYYHPSTKPKFPKHSSKEVYSCVGGRKAYFTYINDTLSSSRKRCFIIPFLWKAKRFDRSGNLVAEGLLRRKGVDHYGELGYRKLFLPIGKWHIYDAEGNLIETKKYRNNELIKTKK